MKLHLRRESLPESQVKKKKKQSLNVSYKLHLLSSFTF